MLKRQMICFAVLAVSTFAWADPATQPTTTAPTIANLPATQPSVDTILGEMDSAYARLAGAQFNGHITGNFDINGQTSSFDLPFTSSFTGPNQFRHQSTGDLLLGSTGKTVYAYLGGRDEYQSAEAPKTRVPSGDWPPVVQLLTEQNPSLLLAISKSAGDELRALSKTITLQPPTTLDGVYCDTLKFDFGDDHDSLTLLVDPTTHLLRRAITDRKNSSMKAGAIDVKLVTIMVDYTSAIPLSPPDPGQFAWNPPAGAVQVSATPSVMASADDSEAHKQMIGQPAPNFTLPDLADQPVTSSKLKGSVVVLDFWATWCAPCVMALPQLDELYKAQSPNGLKMFAIDQQEDKAKVADFVKSKGWTMPILLDSDAAVSAKYKVVGIPQTVVIGKDGKIKQIFVGFGNDQAIAALVAKEMGT